MSARTRLRRQEDEKRIETLFDNEIDGMGACKRGRLLITATSQRIAARLTVDATVPVVDRPILLIPLIFLFWLHDCHKNV